MSQIYMSRRKTAGRTSGPACAKGRQTVSASGASLQGSGMGAQLDEHMQARFRRHFLDRQIPEAEKEADRLSSGVRNAFTPEAVKAQMGQAMGADFSGVRFHTGSEDAARTDAMGAQAYTTGQDVYFGEGGFDPGVAAHELVHTVQQGAVDSAVPTIAAPAGGVQMKQDRKQRELPLGPDLQEMFDEGGGQEQSAAPAQQIKKAGSGHSLHGGFFSKVGELFEKGKSALEDKPEEEQGAPAGFWGKVKQFGGKIKKGFRSGMRTALNGVSGMYESFMRKQDRAMDNLALNREEFNKMGMLGKLKWLKSNPAGALAMVRQSGLGMLAHPGEIWKTIKEQKTGNPFKLAKAVFQRGREWGSERREQARQEAEERQNFMSGLVDEAKAFLVEYDGRNAASEQAGTGGENQEGELPLGPDLQELFNEDGGTPKSEEQGELPLGPDLQELFNENSEQPENTQTDTEGNEEGSGLDPMDIIEKAQTLNEAAGVLGMDEDIGGAIGGALDTAESGIETNERRKRGDTAGTVAGALQTVGNISSASASIIGKVGSIDKISDHAKTILGKAGSGLGIVSEGMMLAGNVTNLVGSSVARTKLAKRLERMNNTDAAGKQQERFRTLNQAYKMSKVNQMQSGTGAVSSMLGVTSSSLKMTGVGIPAAKAIDWVKKGVSLVGGSIASRMGKQMRSDVVNEESSADAKIEAFKEWYRQKHNEDLDDHNAKHAVLKAMGFESGKRREIFLSITKDRAHRMTKDANEEDMESVGIVNDMGLKKGENGRYNEKAVAEKLGGGSDVDDELEQVRKSRAFGF